MDQIIIDRFEHYFRHRDPEHDVLAPGDTDPACRNVRAAIALLGIKGNRTNGNEVFDDDLSEVVRQFQLKYRHRAQDGIVGPGTRRLLLEQFLDVYPPEVFRRLPAQRQHRSVFLSYAHDDAAQTDMLDRWLRESGVCVVRDLWHFKAGGEVAESARKAIAASDKVLAMLSANSRERRWPLLEWAFAEEVERQIKTPILLFVCLDRSPLPAQHQDRLAIPAGIPLEEQGRKILHALGLAALEPPPPPPPPINRR